VSAQRDSKDCGPKSDAAKSDAPKAEGGGRDLKQVKLFIDNRQIPDLPLTVDLCNDQLFFDLVYTTKKENTANRTI
jgi:hypothetical protein